MSKILSILNQANTRQSAEFTFSDMEPIYAQSTFVHFPSIEQVIF